MVIKKLKKAASKIFSIGIFLVVSILFIAQNCIAQAKRGSSVKPETNTLLWEISGKGLKKPSYMFGTFHIMCKGDIRFSENLKEALRSCKDVYFEIAPNESEKGAGLMEMMMMKDKTLDDLFTKEEMIRIEKYFQDNAGIPITSFKKMKPMVLEAVLYPSMLKCNTPSGIETELKKLCGTKVIKGLETVAFQASIFDSIPYEEQAKSFLKNIDSSAVYKNLFNKMLSTYKNQELEKIGILIADTSFIIGENDDVLLKNRNINWVNQLRTILKTSNIFMAVGAGHLVGKDGLIALMRKEGYTVKGIRNR
jgi:uncharacterized protein